MQRRLYLTLFAALAVASGQACSTRESDPGSVDTSGRVSSSGVFVPDSAGAWIVVGHFMPGVSAMSEVEAAAFRGAAVRLTPSKALTEGQHCDKPSYVTRLVSSDSLLADFKLRRETFAPLATIEELTLVDVLCGGTAWTALGGQLFVVSRERAFTHRDGVFFELEKRRDFVAAGQEPFWRLRISEGLEIRLSRVGQADVVTPVPRPAIDSATNTRTYHAVTEANDLRLVISPARCIDSMSGASYEFAVTMTLNGTAYRGCGGPAS